jgi:glycosyltransferase involved in cell wall biosynthesis
VNVALSLIICTRDRATHLRPTLSAMARLDVPANTEIILADNGSSDDTKSVWEKNTSALQAAGFATHYLFDARRGQCHARNSGLQKARGEIIVFTDDDVRPQRNWLAELSTPILSGACDGVCGAVHFAPHLQRDWMTPLQRGWLASTHDEERNKIAEPGRLIGANMAFARRVLERVPAFDTELGPGQLGFCDDILFSLQLKEAGFRLGANWKAKVEHHFDETRLSYDSLAQRAAMEGRSQAYFWYHWLHEPVRAPQLKLQIFSLQLQDLQRREYSRHRNNATREGCSEAEMLLLQKVHCYRQYLVERRRPRNYELRGLVKKISRADL